DSPIADFLDQEQLSLSRFIDTEKIKKLSALYTEFTGNRIVLTQLRKSPDYEPTLSYDCLKLLLQTLYIDIGPELLKTAYELQNKFRVIERCHRDAEFLEQTIIDLKKLATEIVGIRNRLTRGQYEEPRSISTMVWTF